ncbi:TetR/AcrR family transcriptional regulator [Mycolicibacterium llatzerense]|uniref:TetR/AcrR family transcriptional regulator n=1 Tax=Mycolicibacterium llatzerense TaxID=280871 RepID=UPI0021B5A736|nr:TetR/AcrR family transcriptional regulator [Mycolicibacterium llatzerense]
MSAAEVLEWGSITRIVPVEGLSLCNGTSQIRIKVDTRMTRQSPNPDRGEKRRERVLESALSIFARRGYQVSLAEIAEAAGITRTVLYHYFDSKLELFESVFQRQVSELLEVVAPTFIAAGSPEERMRQLLRNVLRFAQSKPESWDLLFRQTDEAEPEVADVRARAQDHLRATAISMFTAELQRQRLVSDRSTVSILFEMSLGALTYAINWWRVNPEVSIEELEVAVARMQGAFLRSLLSDADAAF